MIKNLFHRILKLFHLISKAKYEFSSSEEYEKYLKIVKSPFFDKKWYIKRYSSSYDLLGDPAYHYLTQGAMLGLNPSLRFSTNAYFEAYPDVKEAKLNPLVHFEMYKEQEQRNHFRVIEQITPDNLSIDPFHQNHSLSSIFWLRYLPFLQPRFSLIMASYNRAHCIEQALNSVLDLPYKKFELILVDDGSSDSTSEIIETKYTHFIKSGKLKYIRMPKNGGVCKARNAGLQAAQYEWISYVDSDNLINKDFFAVFSNAIRCHPSYKTFYGVLHYMLLHIRLASNFNYQSLIRENFIDLGTFVHHRSLYESLGGFDESLKRLVDWDLIIRYTENNYPYFCDDCVLLYNDDEQTDRITNTVPLDNAKDYIRNKHADKRKPIKVTTIITTYNHQDYVAQAIESAIEQRGEFDHEILLADDASTDETGTIMQAYAERYPHLIRNISSKINRGISGNMKHCFEEATGEFIAVLEGDDYWSHPEKLSIQMLFLMSHPECSMVFNRTETLMNDKLNLIRQQEGIPETMTGLEFTKIAMNLVANFSSCMFKTSLMKNLPEGLYERRLSEVVLIYHLERFGKIGHIRHCLSVYRVHDNGVWSGSDDVKRFESALFIREHSYRIARWRIRPTIHGEVRRYRRLLRKAKQAVQESLQ